MFRDANDGFAPQAYYTEITSTSGPGFIIMDDLSDRCITFGLFRCCTVQQFWNVAKKAAHFQAIAACKGKDFFKFQSDFHINEFHEDVFEPKVRTLLKHFPSRF